jgi:hypothetical protein
MINRAGRNLQALNSIKVFEIRIYYLILFLSHENWQVIRTNVLFRPVSLPSDGAVAIQHRTNGGCRSLVSASGTGDLAAIQSDADLCFCPGGFGTGALSLRGFINVVKPGFNKIKKGTDTWRASSAVVSRIITPPLRASNLTWWIKVNCLTILTASFSCVHFLAQ